VFLHHIAFAKVQRKTEFTKEKLEKYVLNLGHNIAHRAIIAPDSRQTILKVHLYATDLGEIIPSSEKRASDLVQISTLRA
jgi:hypothetical protein